MHKTGSGSVRRKTHVASLRLLWIITQLPLVACFVFVCFLKNSHFLCPGLSKHPRALPFPDGTSFEGVPGSLTAHQPPPTPRRSSQRPNTEVFGAFSVFQSPGPLGVFLPVGGQSFEGTFVLKEKNQLKKTVQALWREV